MSLYQYQEIRDARRNTYEWIYGSSIYTKLSSLPLPARAKTFCANRVDDIIEYSGEFTAVALLLYALFTGYSGAGVRQASIYLDVKKIVSHPQFEGTIAVMLPRLYGWYVFVMVECILVKQRAQRVVGAFKWLGTKLKQPKFFRALFGPSPSDAKNIYQSKVRSPDDAFSSKIAGGYIRLHYFPTYDENAKSQQKREYPDVSIDLPIKKKGVDLSLLRKKLGIETLEIISDVEPFRMTFTPANEDWLSPMAAYDLSHQFTKPIRVFEPHVSKSTDRARRIRARFYPTIFRAVSLVKLFLGFPETNIRYLSILYGTEYARFCEDVSDFTRPINQWFMTGGFLLLQLIATIAVLPFFIVYRVGLTSGKLLYPVVTKGLPFIFSSVLQLCVASVFGIATAVLWSMTTFASAIGAFSTFILSLRTRGWLVTLASVWFALAEIHSLQV